MELKNLVPDISLCKRIPAGKFVDSALVWIEGIYDPKKVLRRAESYDEPVVAPAPTLAEILAAFADKFDDVLVSNTLAGGWLAQVGDLRSGHFADVSGDNPAAAALRLWLEVEGVK